jgi:heme-degrading monooxygenase HmoA
MDGHRMQALLFEMTPRDGHEQHYFRHAATLRPILMQHDGLFFIERFKSLTRANVILSHSLWRDEASIARWRTNSQHQQSQTAGRFKHFEDYRIRISHVLQHIEHGKPQKSWTKEGAYNDAATTPDCFLTIIRTTEMPKTEEGEVFESVAGPNIYLTVASVSSEDDGQAKIEKTEGDDAVLSALLGRVSRDYGMFERAEAPQYFKPVERQR